ncbi:MAG: hypothetical protein U9N57_10250 [Pseudomonadota bacterium]|nr:hypothetical protein [Pseudomonadota bacterium]
MNNVKQGLLLASVLSFTFGAATAVHAQNWPQPESAYMSSTQSPQWVEHNSAQNHAPAMPNMQQSPYGNQPPRPYPASSYGYAPYGQPFNGQYMSQPMPYAGNNGWGNWPNQNNNMMPSMPNMGNWSAPNMNMGNWSMPEMPEMNNMPGMPNMDNFSMPSPSFGMPSPSFNTPTMNMPFFN